ncbi:hypothetical protein [Catellatospora sp. NPDC049133]|uniref:hypothetical protein n=1 Tax=Catellatospora sp. NPDC049133 TaxID=3155499 RepID=UPI0033C15123
MQVTCELAMRGEHCRASVVHDIGPADVDTVVRHLCDAVEIPGCRRLTVDLGEAVVLEP